MGGIGLNIRELMDVALKAGEILLTSGAEIYRVEDTIIRICRSYNFECESFILPTGMFVSIAGSEREFVSFTKRIKERTVDLHRIELVNTFSRNLKNNAVPYKEAMNILEGIENTRHFSFIIRLMAAGVTAFVFTLLFKGGIVEGTAAFFISVLIYFLREKISQTGFFQFFEFFVSGMTAGAVSLVAVSILPGLNIYKIIIGSIMILLPGVAITNGIKDALYGDIVSSLARLGEAVFIAAAVGAGVGIALSVGLHWI